MVKFPVLDMIMSSSSDRHGAAIKTSSSKHGNLALVSVDDAVAFLSIDDNGASFSILGASASIPWLENL